MCVCSYVINIIMQLPLLVMRYTKTMRYSAFIRHIWEGHCTFPLLYDKRLVLRLCGADSHQEHCVESGLRLPLAELLLCRLQHSCVLTGGLGQSLQHHCTGALDVHQVKLHTKTEHKIRLIYQLIGLEAWRITISIATCQTCLLLWNIWNSPLVTVYNKTTSLFSQYNTAKPKSIQIHTGPLCYHECEHIYYSNILPT